MKIGICKNKKEDIFALFLFFVSFFTIYFVLTRGEYLYGSSMDWESQHYLIPEYFRNLFYETGELLPNFAPHLGAGQNIYYFSYYGLFSPLILFSYLLPFIKMVDYIQFLGICIPLSSTILFYFYLKKHTTYRISLFLSLLYLFASPITFHSHRHIMFINYMPFLMLAFYGIDAYFEKGKMFLLTFACILLIFTSYYYSVGALIALFCYGIYYYLRRNVKNRKQLFFFCIPFFLSILSAMVLLLPTLYALLHGRTGGGNTSIFKYFLPNQKLSFTLYHSYAMGLTCISLVATLYVFLKKGRGNRFLGAILLFLSIFPIGNYLLNGTLYVDGKALIPFVPILLLFTIPFYEEFEKGQVSIKKFIIGVFLFFFYTKSRIALVDLGVLLLLFLLFYHFKREKFFFYSIAFVSFAICLSANLVDKLEKRSTIDNPTYKNVEKAVEWVTQEDEHLYRINNQYAKPITMNTHFAPNHYTTTLYSSTFNSLYNQFVFDTMNNAIPHRNRSMTPASTNPLFQVLMGEKYILSEKELSYGTKKKEFGNIKVYALENVMPLGYATSSLLSEEMFQTLPYPDNVVTLLTSIVVPQKKADTIEKRPPTSLHFEILKQDNIKIEQNNALAIIKAKKNARMRIKVRENITGQILFLRFKNRYNPTCSKTELAITINDVKNKLSCSTWKYHNKNTVFDYVLQDANTLDITFAQGEYFLTDFSFSLLSEEELFKEKQISIFVFDQEKTKGDIIEGKINVLQDGYFTFTIPYDKGFHLFIDGKEVLVEKVNTAFIGTPIQRGEHSIRLVYKAPYQKVGRTFSLIGFILTFIVFFLEHRNYKKRM